MLQGPTAWTDIIALCGLALLGYWGAGLLGRWRIPEVTAFLLAGVLLGPHAIGVLDAGTLQRLGIIQPVALGLMVFLVGRELTVRALRRHSVGFWVTLTLALVLPAVFVWYAGDAVWEGPTRLVVLLAIVAISGAPTTVLAIRSELRRGGRVADTLLGIAAIDNVVTVAAYSIALPFLRRGMLDDWSVLGASLEIGRLIGVAIVLGVVGGWVLEYLLRKARGDGERLAVGVFMVAVLVAVANALGTSALLAPLIAGVTVATLAERRRESGRVFGALSSLEYPLYVVFYALAGTELDVRALAAGGALAVVYILARSTGKITAGFIGGLTDRLGARGAMWLGLGLLPQAGVAVGLALDAGVQFPEVGATFATVVLAAIVVFEFVGPIALRGTMERLCDPFAEANGDGPVCVEHVYVAGVGPQTDGADVIAALDVTLPADGCASLVELVAVVPPGGSSAAKRSLDAAARLEAAAVLVRDAGYVPRTRVVRSASIEAGLAEAAADADAHGLVLPVACGSRGIFGMAPIKRRRHRIADALGIPVFIVPMSPRVLEQSAARRVAEAEAGSAAETEAEEPLFADIQEREAEREEVAETEADKTEQTDDAPVPAADAEPGPGPGADDEGEGGE